MNTPFAPTLVIGLGGSGVAIVREMKKRVTARENVTPPVVYLAFDLDGGSRRATETGGLAEDELLVFPADAVATCVRNLNRTETDLDGRSTAYPFAGIREWFPLHESRELGRATLDSAGAGQWRPIGRVGFYMNDGRIVASIKNAKTKLEQARRAAPASDSPMVYIVSSIVGGTGAGMLMDVAANVSKHLHGYSVVALLLLPELYEKLDFTENIFANAFGTLWEIAYLKNQHIIFEADYPVAHSIDANDGIVPFRRVYLFAGAVGKRQPFREPSDAYPYVADLLTLHLTRFVRRDLVSYQANASGDAGRLLSDPASTYAFGEIAAMGIRLMSFDDLARRLVAGFAREVTTQTSDDIMSLFRGDDAAAASTWITALLDEAEHGVTQQALEVAVQAEFDPYRRQTLIRTTVPDTAEFARRLDTLLGLQNDGSLPPFLAEIASRISERAVTSLQTEAASYVVPGSRREYLEMLSRSIPAPAPRPQFDPIPDLDDLRSWSTNAPFAWLLARPHTPAKMMDAEQAALRHVAANIDRYAAWARSAAADAIRRLIEQSQQSEQQGWAELQAFSQAMVADLEPAVRIEAIASGEEVYLDSRRSPEGSNAPAGAREAEALRQLVADVNSAQRADFRLAFGRALSDALTSFRGASDPLRRATAAREWVDSVSELLRQRFGQGPATRPPYQLLSPAGFFSDSEILEAVQRCATPLFQDGRVPPSVQRRTVRVLVPPEFVGHEQFLKKMLAICNGTFGVQAQKIEALDSEAGDRVVVVVENLFRAAEEIEGIYDYHRDYMRHSNRALFHVDRRWLPQLRPLITKAGRITRIACGNEGCSADLSSVPDDVRICPGCRNPIRNRCGNPGCAAINLASRAEIGRAIERRQCPECHGFLHTYWWKCSKHGDVPADKPTCPRCVAAGTPLRPFSWRPDLRDRFVCPSCIAAGHSEPFEASGSAARWLTYGVNGQDVPAARKFIREKLTKEGNCPVCGTPLVPFCPLSDAPTENRHFSYRDPAGGSTAPFRCYHHLDEFLACAVCHFPAVESDSMCRRCHTELRRCRFCTKRFHLLVPVSQEPHARCAHCSTFLDDVIGGQQRPSERHNDLFCSNIFGCPAGARLYEATFPAGTETCPICSVAAPPLLEVQTRAAHIGVCPFCRQLFAGHVAATSPEGVRPEQRLCCLCGQSLAAVEALARDREAFNSALACAQALLLNDTEEETFHHLYQEFATSRRSATLAVQQFFASIASPEVSAIVRPRIEAFLRHWRRQFGCGGGGESPNSAGSDVEAGKAEASTALDLEFALSHENDVPRWILYLRARGFEKDSLDSLGASLKDQTSLPIDQRRVDHLIYSAKDLWDSV